MERLLDRLHVSGKDEGLELARAISPSSSSLAVPQLSPGDD
jgi:hypothetical protein